MIESQFPLSIKSCNLVRFCEHPDYDALHPWFMGNFAFKDKKSRFSILKNYGTAPGPDTCFSLKFTNTYPLFKKLLGMKFLFPGQNKKQSKGQTYYNSINYYRSHIDEIFYQNSTCPLPPVEGWCSMYYPATNILNIVYELRNTSEADVTMQLNWFSRPEKGLRFKATAGDNSFSFSNVQRQHKEYEAFARITAYDKRIRFSWDNDIFSSEKLSTRIAPRSSSVFVFTVEFSFSSLQTQPLYEYQDHKKEKRNCIKRVENVYQQLPDMPQEFKRFESLVFKAAGTLQTLRCVELNKEKNQVTTIHPSRGALAATYFWDTAFSLLGLNILDDYESSCGATSILIDGIDPKGKPPSRYVDGKYNMSFQQPIMAWGINHLDPDKIDQNILKEWYAPLKRYVLYWLNNCDSNKNGLVEYPAGGVCLDDALRWQDKFPIAFEKGEDWARKDWGTMSQQLFENCDTNAHLYLECLSMAEYAKRLGLSTDEQRFRQLAEKLRKNINRHMFNKDAGAYQDRSIIDNRFSEMTTLGSFIPLYAGLADMETGQQICRKFILNPSRFYTYFPFPVIDRSHPSFRSGGGLKPLPDKPDCLVQQAYWRGRTWPHSSYWVLGALYQYGFEQEADQAACQILEVMSKSEGIYECYDSLTGQGNGHVEFMWSSAAVLAIAFQLYKESPVLIWKDYRREDQKRK